MARNTMPRGSALQIYATDWTINGGDNTVKYNKVTEHNRSDIAIQTTRYEKSMRMADGSLRKFFIKDKRVFSVSWDMLPAYRTLTVDNCWGAEDLRYFYNSIEGQKEFLIKINLAKDGTNQENTGFELFNVVISSLSFTLLKRGLQPFWNVSLTMEEV
jgi:hypothetical protein